MNNQAVASSTAMRRDRRYANIYLLNLIIPIAFLSMFSAQKALIGALMIGGFAGIYLLTFRVKGQKYLFIALQVGMMMVMMAYLNPGYIWMIFYPAATIGVFFRQRKVIGWIAGMSAILLAENYILSLFESYTMSDWLMIFAAIVAGFAACYGTVWQARTMRSREELREANLQIERLTKVAERERISRDLHDVMGHELSMITLKSQLAVKLIDRDGERAKAEIRDIEQAARQALTRVREYIAVMRQPNLDEEWEDAIKLLSAAGITCDAESSELLVGSDEGTVHALAMCVREATTNLVRHSMATECQLRLFRDGDALCLMICDNGKGIISQANSGGVGGNGISGMRARVAAVGGDFSLWSNGASLGGQANEGGTCPSPWPNGVALIIRVPEAMTHEIEEVEG